MKNLKVVICELADGELETIFGGEEQVVYELVNGVYVARIIWT